MCELLNFIFFTSEEMFLSSELELEWDPGRSQLLSSTCSITAVKNIPEVPFLNSGASLLLEITNTLQPQGRNERRVLF